MKFYNIVAVNGKNGSIELYPDFLNEGTDSDLMVKGKSFYAIWNEELGLWSQNEYDVQKIVDRDLMAKKTELENAGANGVRARMMRSNQTKTWMEYKGYLNRLPDRFVPLDDKLTFADTEVRREDYVSKRLPYTLKPADHAAYDELMSTLYSPENREKIEWAIGSILSGDSKSIQKFYVLYGKGGTGKGTVLKIIGKLFKGYDCAFRAEDLASKTKDFSMEGFKDNPLVAIDEDGNLSRIEDSTRINSIVSHERMLMNEKGKPHYPYIPHCTLFIGSNEPVKIKDEESGLIRRLIDIEPLHKKTNPIPGKRYNALIERVDFELGGIAYHCLEVYRKLGKHYFDNYRPLGMIYRTNVFFNFIEDSFDVFLEHDGVTLKNAYVMWNNYCNEAGVDNRMPRQKFREELKNYFEHFDEITRVDGKQVRSWYSGFKRDCLDNQFGISSSLNDKVKDAAARPETGKDEPKTDPPAVDDTMLQLTCETSLLDDILKDCVAQYDDGMENWDSVKTTLKDLDTHQTHWLLPPEWVLMIDFDLKNDKGEKDMQKNLEAASKWPQTYAELSKSGGGIHLYYRFTGDLDELLSKYAKDVEIKVYHGKAAIRRRVSKCNNLPIATISSGLPTKPKKEKKNTMVDISVVELERYLTNCIRKAMRKEIDKCSSTKSSCDYIKHILDEAYDSGKHYDVGKLRHAVYGFAMGSTNNKRYCTDLVRKMHWCSKDASTPVEPAKKNILVFFDIEVFPNVNMVNWKIAGKEHPVVRLINPTPNDIEELLQYSLIGFNCRKYDNHILHAIRLGYSPEKVYEVSKMLIDNSGEAYFREAWDYSMTDIYDFSSKKQGLKKFEIELGIHHKELGMDWTKPVPKEKWQEVAEYCDNDVLATEALFFSKDRQADWVARQILADIAGMSVNSTTNSLTTRIIFGDDKKPQSQFNYRNLGTSPDEAETYTIVTHLDSGEELDPNYTVFDALGRPVFPGYLYKRVDKDEKGEPLKKPYWASFYRGEEIGEGGYVYGEEGTHMFVALLDIASMHPSSIEDEQLFGKTYTKRFSDLKQARVYVKHGEYEKAKQLFDGKLAKYLDDPEQAEALSSALKIAINSVYGLTSAKFDNPFHDPRNKDNIVAKRGALFMVNLKHEVQRRGFTVAHIKTDSIKIPNATPEIIKFVTDYGKLYGYSFEHEMTYERMCLITKADYVARCATEEQAMALHGYLPTKQKKHAGEWTETGDWFKDNYLFKTLFTHEPITLNDMYEVNSVTTALYLDMNENLSKDRHNYIFIGKCGAFTPVLPGTGGGELVRENKGKYDSANGAKGYRWKEFEVVRDLHLDQQVNRSYYDKRTEAAKKQIERFCPFDLFVSDIPIPKNYLHHSDTPWN